MIINNRKTFLKYQTKLRKKKIKKLNKLNKLYNE